MLLLTSPLKWVCCNGDLAHALGTRYKSETRDRPICGAKRYSFGSSREATARSVKCIRCLRLLGRVVPKKLRVRAELLNAELRVVRMRMRRACAK